MSKIRSFRILSMNSSEKSWLLEARLQRLVHNVTDHQVLASPADLLDFVVEQSLPLARQRVRRRRARQQDVRVEDDHAVHVRVLRGELDVACRSQLLEHRDVTNEMDDIAPVQAPRALLPLVTPIVAERDVKMRATAVSVLADAFEAHGARIGRVRHGFDDASPLALEERRVLVRERTRRLALERSELISCVSVSHC